MKPRKSIIITIFTACLFLIVAAVPAFAVNSFTNANFESGAISPWLVKDSLHGDEIQVLSSGNQNGSYHGLHIIDSETEESFIYQDSVILSNAENVSFYYRINTAEANNNNIGSPSYYFYIFNDNTWTTAESWNSTGNLIKDNAWHKVTLTGDPMTGTYRIGMILIHGGGVNTFWVHLDNFRINDIPLVETPVASITASPLTGSEPLQVTFTDTSTNVPTAWYYDFGDNTNSTAQSPVHTYTSSGIYNVKFKAENSAGYSWYNSTSITVGYAPGSTDGGFRLTGDYTYTSTIDTAYNGFNAKIEATDPNILYDKIVWTLDGGYISDADITAMIVTHKELKNVSGTWLTYWPAYTEAPWQSGGGSGYQLLNQYYFKSPGNHILGCKIYYNNITVADLSLTVTATSKGAFSSAYIHVRNNYGGLISNSWVNSTDLQTGITYNWLMSYETLGGTDFRTGIRGHTYRFTVSAPGYTTITRDDIWPDYEQASIPDFILFNDTDMPVDTTKAYLFVEVKTLGNAPIGSAWVTLRYSGISQTYTMQSDGTKTIQVPKNTFISYEAGANLQGYQVVSGNIQIGTANYPLIIKLPLENQIATPTPAPYTPTPVPTQPGGSPYPGYPVYTDTERTKIIEGGIDSWIGAIPGLINLIILVCIVTLIGYMSTATGPKRRR